MEAPELSAGETKSPIDSSAATRSVVDPSLHGSCRNQHKSQARKDRRNRIGKAAPPPLLSLRIFSFRQNSVRRLGVTLIHC